MFISVLDLFKTRGVERFYRDREGKVFQVHRTQ